MATPNLTGQWEIMPFNWEHCDLKKKWASFAKDRTNIEYEVATGSLCHRLSFPSLK